MTGERTSGRVAIPKGKYSGGKRGQLMKSGYV